MAEPVLDLENMSREELLAEVRELQQDLTERDDFIARLTREAEAAKGKRRGRGSDELDQENQELRDRLEKERSDAQDEKAEMSAQLRVLVADKLEADDDLRAAKARVSELERELVDARDSSRSALARSQDVSKQRSDAQRQQLQMLQENETLQRETRELAAQVSRLEDARVELEAAVTRVAAERDDADAAREASDIAKEGLETQLADMQEALEASEGALLEVEASEVALRQRLEAARQQFDAALAQETHARERAQADATALRTQISVLKDTTAMGTKQAEVDALLEERDAALARLATTAEELEEATEERDQLAERLVEFEQGIGAEVEERVQGEKQSSRVLEGRLRIALERLAQETDKVAGLEAERRLLSGELDELAHWKGAYESGHGMQELARSQKRVKEDNRRLGIALEQVTRKLGEAMDGNGVIAQAFERLCRESGRPPGFSYDEGELREESLSDKARLRAQVLELEAQIEALEGEAVRVRRALKNQAGALGEQGFRFAGMDAEMLVRVNDFATRLREGRELEDERPIALLQENRRLRDEARAAQLRLEMLQRDFGGGGGGGGAEDSAMLDSQLRGLRDDVKRLLVENGELKNRVARMQDELLLALGRQGGGADATAISSVLVANNELLLGQLHDLRLQLLREPAADERDPPSPAPGSVGLSRDRSGLPPLGRTTGRLGQTGRLMDTLDSRVADAAVPSTPHGKTLLQRTLAGMNLPPEEWAAEVRESSGQLVECLEQLFEREAELGEQRGVVSSLERTLMGVKQQLAALYVDHARRVEEHRLREAQLRADNACLSDERDDLRLRLRRLEETVDLLQREDPSALEARARELSRRVTVYEVNEAVLSRRFTAQAEQLASEVQRRMDLERDLAELESGLKKRILYLEQSKLGLAVKVERLEGRLARAAPIDDFREAQLELENLREDHLEALRREMDARVALLQMGEQGAALAGARAGMESASLELLGCRAKLAQLGEQLEDQRRLTARASSASSSSSEMASAIADLGRYRAEIGRLELEAGEHRRQMEATADRAKLLAARERELVKELEEQRTRALACAAKEAEARAESMGWKMRYESGLTRDEADALRHERERSASELDLARAENQKLRAIAEIATQQAQTTLMFKHHGADELKELLQLCASAEGRCDDDLIIGRLQRQLMATKASYKTFAHKYHVLRGDLGQRELAVRALEHRLDLKDAAVLRLQSSHRSELTVIRKAVKDLEAFGGDAAQADRGSTRVSKLGVKISSISRKLGSVAELTQTAVTQTLELEERARVMAGELADADADKELLRRRCLDLEAACLQSTEESRRQLAGRLVALSDDVRASMLAELQQKREISVLAQEKRHMQSLLATLEGNVRALEESKVRGDSRHLLPALGDGAQDRELRVIEELLFSADPWAGEQLLKPPTLNAVNSELGAADLLAKLQHAGEQVAQTKRASEEFKARTELRILELERSLAERDESVRYLEGLLRREGLPLAGEGSPRGRREDAVLRSEQDEIQRAASATIGSLTALLEERGATIERYRDRLATLESGGRPRSVADLNAEAVLQHLDSEGAPRGSRVLLQDQGQQRLIAEVERAELGAFERDRTIAQLEAKLAAQANARERAEVRCGSALEEMQAMKRDMVTLVQRLQEAESRSGLVKGRAVVRRAEGKEDDAAAVAGEQRPVVDQKTLELKRALRGKDEKIRGYREIILKLKDEFIKSEEQRALFMLKATGAEGGREKESTLVNRGEMEDLRSQIAALKDGLRTAKEDLEAAKRTREKLTRARMSAQEETERLDAQLVRSEASAAAAQDSLARVRKELEESRKKESQLRGKLKEATEAAELGGDKAQQSRVSGLEKEVGVLRAQNAALRRQDGEGDWKRLAAEPQRREAAESKVSGRAAGDETGTRPSDAGPVAAPKEEVRGPKEEVRGPKEEVRGQAHAKWEADKKAEKRLATLEKRLQEKSDECAELAKQLSRARSAPTQREDEGRRQREQRSATAESVSELELARGKVFELEEQGARLLRRCEVELANEISSLRHQLLALRNEASEREGREGEDARRGGGGQGRSIRDSEDRFLREERLRDDVSAARKEKAELELAMLDKDSRLLEMRFDLENRASELERLRRRCRELESSYKILSAVKTTEKAGSAGPESRGGAVTSGGRREQEVEGVVEALKKVVEKLRVENERLKKGATDDKRSTDAEKRAAAERKRADGLEAELRQLQGKQRVQEDTAQKLVQRQQQVALLRKQLRTREEEAGAGAEARRQLEAVADEARAKAQLADRRASDLEARLVELESDGPRSRREDSSAEARKLAQKLGECERTIQELKSSLFSAQQENVRQKMGGVSSSSQREGPGESEALRALREENERLKDELGAFDLDFFEEIENLKYAHAEAVRKLRALEQRGAGGVFM